MQESTQTHSIAPLQTTILSPRLITLLLLLAALVVMITGNAAAMETFHVI
ncbi:hypothetical protein [Haladaptatus sp. DJG-WS-42]